MKRREAAVSITSRAVRPGFHALSGNVARRQAALAIALGGAAWILGTLQFGVAQLVSASAWSPTYSWTTKYISDPGNTACGQFAVPHGAAMYVCSPPFRALMSVALALWVLTIGIVAIGASVRWRREPEGVFVRATIRPDGSQRAELQESRS